MARLFTGKEFSGGNVIDVSVEEKEFAEALQVFEKMEESITPRWLKNTQRRAAMKEMVPAMRRNSLSTRLEDFISVTTAKKRAGDLGIKVGVVKNDVDTFPDFSAQALASVIEYGTAERHRELKAAGILVTGRQSTGVMPAAPFLRPAWDAHVKSFMDDVQDAIERKVLRAA